MLKTENAYHSFTKPLFHKTYLTGSMIAKYVTHLHTKMSKSSQMSILLFEMLQLYNVSLQSASKPESKQILLHSSQITFHRYIFLIRLTWMSLDHIFGIIVLHF